MIHNISISDLALDIISEKRFDDFNIFGDSKLILSNESIIKTEDKNNVENIDKNMEYVNIKMQNFPNNDTNLTDNILNIPNNKIKSNKALLCNKKVSINFKNSAYSNKFWNISLQMKL